MRLTRAYVDSALAAGARVSLEGSAAAHVRRVLRLETGDALTLFNGDGQDYPSRIAGFGRDSVEVEVAGTAAARAESPLAFTLVQGIARAERMDLVVQKATELGVVAIVPVATARSVVKLDAASRDRKSAHWRAIAISACEQCGRARIPAIADPQHACQPGLQCRPARVCGCCCLRTPMLRSPLPRGKRRRSSCWSARRAGSRRRSAARRSMRAIATCRLGPRVLRSETAAIAAIAVLQSLRETSARL